MVCIHTAAILMVRPAALYQDEQKIAARDQTNTPVIKSQNESLSKGSSDLGSHCNRLIRWHFKFLPLRAV